MINSYNDVTIGKYQELKSIIESGFDEAETHIKLIAVLNDMDEDEVGNLSLTEFQNLNTNLLFLTEMPQQKIVATKYKLGKYEFETMMNIQDMTVSQYIDYQTFVKDTDKYLVELISIFLIPKGKKYNEGYDIIDVQKVIKENLCIVDALSLAGFFLLWYQSLMKATLNSLIRRLKKMKRKMKNQEEIQKMEEAIANLEKSGGGLRLLTK